MSRIFDDEFTCDVCQCTYLDPKSINDHRCAAHRDLPETVEEDVKYLHKDISNVDLANRVEKLERDVAELTAIVTAEKIGYHKTCEDCKQEFTASAPAVKKCPTCKGKAN